MSLYLDLLPAPQFDRSLVAYTVGNFQRVRDILTRASGRIYVYALQASGPYPINMVVKHPFKANVLVTMSVSGYAPAAGLTGVNPYYDGGLAAPTLLYFFNIASDHRSWSASFMFPSMTAGDHTWGYAAGAGLASDNNDKVSWGFTFSEV